LLSVDFSTETYTVSASAGVASITLDNNAFPGPNGQPTAAAAQVGLLLSGGTAQPGVDYLPENQIVNFAAGETSKTVQIPVLPGNSAEGTRVLQIHMSQAPGSPPTSRAFLLITRNADTTPPAVSTTKMLTKGPYVTGFVITFSKDMATGPVQDVNNYVVDSPRSLLPAKVPGLTTASREVRLKSAVYNAATHSVTLTTAGRVRKSPFFMILDPQSAYALKLASQFTTGIPSAPPPVPLPQLSQITDTTGNPLDSTHSGTADGALTVFVAKGKLGNALLGSMNMISTPPPAPPPQSYPGMAP
jgi:hypothetical protein